MYYVWGASGLERRTGGRVVLSSNPAGAASPWNFGNSVYPTLSVSFGGDIKSHWRLLSTRGSKTSHTEGGGGKYVTFCGLQHS